MPQNIETKKVYAEKYGGFWGAIIYLIHKKLGMVSFGETEQ